VLVPVAPAAPALGSEATLPADEGWVADVPLGAVVTIRAGAAATRAAEALVRRSGGALVRVAADEPHAGPWAPGTVILVEREDPSPVLPWLLRRLDEGAIVLLTSAARTPEGARRTLLGVHATARAEAWLAAFPWISAPDV
jgi:hypothetical protein